MVTSDTTAPTVTQITAVPSPTNDITPNYTFNTNEAGTVVYGGDCSSATVAAVLGNNTVTFNALSAAAHSNCTIKVTDAAGNQSAALAVNSFTIDITGPTVTINQASGQTDPTMGSTINFTVVFSESVSNFATGDVTSPEQREQQQVRLQAQE